MLETNYIACIDCLKGFAAIPSSSIDLIYLDPPFFTQREFAIHGKSGLQSFSDNWNGGLESYLEFMQQVLMESRRILRRSGSLYMHCDWHASHYLKVKADTVFGYNNFRNEIVWKRHNSHNDNGQGSRILGRIHDTILLYAKSDEYKWNDCYLPYSQDFIDKYYKYVEPGTGRRYALGDLTGPGGASKGNPYYEFMGVKRYWRYGREKMKKLQEQGRIVCRPSSGLPYLKRYLDEMKGRPIQDIWDDIVSPQRSRTDYLYFPTQKPLRLLERIILFGTESGDVILDPFCGSGTTLVAADKLNRRWIGLDSSQNACDLARKRLAEMRNPPMQIMLKA